MKKDFTYEKNQFPKSYKYAVYFFHDIESFPLHWHHYIEIIYAQHPGVVYEVNGEKIDMESGDILYIWPGELHSIISIPEPEYTLMLQFDAQIITDYIDFRKVAYLFYRTRHLRQKEEPTLVNKLQNILLQIYEISNQEMFMTEIKVCSKIFEIMICLGEERQRCDSTLISAYTPHKFKVEQQLFDICNYLTTHCTENIRLEEAASFAGFSKYHFSRLFKEYTGMGYTEFMDKERIRIAETMLKDGTMSITEISLEAGFNSIATFNRAFLRFKKVSPTKFRQMYQLG
ncbi:MAG: AraC family transcriptional regulator [Lachnospiraceae bacterium]|nr:AraC family transcriptional regulator [Lachnospiraceae bacterium]